jgi:hypothetical protein
MMASSFRPHPSALYLLLDKDAPLSTALERGLWPGVDGCFSTRTTYDHFYYFFSAMGLAFATFAVEKMIVEPK